MASDSLCSIEGCGKRLHHGGYCSMHGERVRLHGTPFTAGRKIRGLCTLPGCVRSHYGRGFCVKHFKRFKKYGDPLGGSTDWGAARAFLDAAATADTSECISFPYSTGKHGYGRVRVGPETVGAHVYVLTKVAGEKPTPKHECCHKCGNGHLGCVNPRHLYWGTRSDNVRDSIAHGTAYPPRKAAGSCAG